MGRMRQMSIERVDAVDEPATGHRWVIAKRSKQADAKPEAGELVKAAIEALRKDDGLSISEEAAEALNALADAHEVEGLKLEKDDEDGEREAADEDAEATEKSDESDDDAEAEDAEQSDDEGDEDADEDEDGDEESTEKSEGGSVDERLAVLEQGMELILQKLDGGAEREDRKVKTTAKRKQRTSKQATGQDDLGEGESLKKSGGRPSFSNVIFG